MQQTKKPLNPADTATLVRLAAEFAQSEHWRAWGLDLTDPFDTTGVTYLSRIYIGVGYVVGSAVMADGEWRWSALIRDDRETMVRGTAGSLVEAYEALKAAAAGLEVGLAAQAVAPDFAGEPGEVFTVPEPAVDAATQVSTVAEPVMTVPAARAAGAAFAPQVLQAYDRGGFAEWEMRRLPDSHAVRYAWWKGLYDAVGQMEPGAAGALWQLNPERRFR